MVGSAMHSAQLSRVGDPLAIVTGHVGEDALAGQDGREVSSSPCLVA
jgi:hypothetical protein